MASCTTTTTNSVVNLGVAYPSINNNKHKLSSPSSSQLSFLSTIHVNSTLRFDHTQSLRSRFGNTHLASAANSPVVTSAVKKAEPVKIMISGAPASGKGTQSELITAKLYGFIKLLMSVVNGNDGVLVDLEGNENHIVPLYGLVHIAAGDLLRSEIAKGSDNGKRAKEFMEKGQLVPDEIVVMMVKDRLTQPDCQQNGWLLDGYPRSTSQAAALKGFGFVPDLFILIEVSEELLVERVVGRRLDPVTGKIYHLKYSPPETEEIAARLTQRFDDTEEKVKLRLKTHHQNVEAVLSLYEEITIKVNGNASKEEVFAHIENAVEKLIEQSENSGSLIA
ncbi:hypothetical protein ACFE04_005907 [Oxalis oulophora]